MHTYYSQKIENNCFVIDGEELSHIFVMRQKIGDKIRIIDNTGYEFFCTISDITKKEAICNIDDKAFANTNSKREVHFFVCIMKGDKNDLVVEKLTELGVTKITFVNSKFVSRLGNLNIDRLKKIALSATKQCGGAIVPEISQTNIDKIEVKNNFFVAYEGEQIEKLVDNEKDISVLIGSEGGLCKSEIDMLVKKGAKIFTLGKRILRTETAAICVASILSQGGM